MSHERLFNRRHVLKAAAGSALLGVLNPLAPLVQAKEETFEVAVLMYHEMSPKAFKNDLLWRINQGEQPVSLPTYISFLDGSINIPAGLRMFLVTCDDGLLSQYRAASAVIDEVRKQTGWFVPMNFFVMTKFNDPPLPLAEIPRNTSSYNDDVHQYMSLGEMIEFIQRGHRVENHTVNHGNLSALSWGARNAEVEGGEERIEEIWQLAGVERDFKTMAYPYGVYQGQLEYVQSLGYAAAFSTISTTVHSSASRFFAGRIRIT